MDSRLRRFNIGGVVAVAHLASTAGSMAVCARVGLKVAVAANKKLEDHHYFEENMPSIKDFLYDDVLIRDESEYTISYWTRNQDSKEREYFQDTIRGKEINDGYRIPLRNACVQLESGATSTPFEQIEIVAGESDDYYKMFLRKDIPHYRDLEYKHKKKRN